MGEFRMPSLGADMDEGTLVEWRVSVGDHVDRGDIVASVETDKSVIDVEVFETGTIQELLVEPGTRVAVGTALARIGDAAAEDEPSEPDVPAHTEPPEPAAPPEPVTSTPPAGSTPDAAPGEPIAPPVTPPTEAPAPAHPHVVVGEGPVRRHASLMRSPLVRHLAEQLHVDPDRLRGTGPGGRITRHDVEHAAATTRRASPRARRRGIELGIDVDDLTGTGVDGAVCERDVVAAASAAEPAAPAPAPSQAADGMRAAIARTMERSNREIPHYHLSATVDLNPLTEWLAEINAERPPAERILPAAAIMRACALAAAKVTDLNGEWRDGAAVTSKQVHLGVLVSLRSGGLIVPVIRDAHERSVEEMMTALTDVVERSRRGSLRSSELSGATITLSNLGDRGVDEVLGVIPPPQLAIVGVGKIAARPMVVDGAVVARDSAVFTLGADHRASDGRTGSRFLRQIESLLANPTRL